MNCHCVCIVVLLKVILDESPENDPSCDILDFERVKMSGSNIANVILKQCAALELNSFRTKHVLPRWATV